MSDVLSDGLQRKVAELFQLEKRLQVGERVSELGSILLV